MPAKPFRDPGNYVHVSRRLAEETGAVWADQFDNLANREGHRRGTATEIWQQTGGAVDAFTCSCGTGGTLAGVSLGLHELAARDGKPVPRIVLADPHGSGLYGWVKSNDPRRQRQLDYRGHRPVTGARQPGGGRHRRRGAHR